MPMMIWMVGMADFLDDSIEAMMFVGYIVDDSLRTVGLVQPVLTFNLITVPRFPSFFMIARMRIVHTVAIFVIDWILKQKHTRKKTHSQLQHENRPKHP